MRTYALIAAGTASLLTAAAAAHSPRNIPSLSDGLSCARAAPLLSCQTAKKVDPDSFGTCCYNGALRSGEEESGLVLGTQFWNLTEGPADSTTVHGLWPDYCSGRYPGFCSADSGIPEKDGAQIEELLQRYDPALLSYMRTYYGNDPSFWDHEYNKHGTCFTTLRAKCQVLNGLRYDNGTSAALVGYFQQIVREFRRAPTYSWLEQAGITPSTTKTYKRADMEAALARRHGGTPYLGCINKTQFSEVWYYNHVRGPLINGRYIPVDSTSPSSCSDDVQYLPKHNTL